MYNLEFVNRWLDIFAADIDAQKEYITQLDADIGDADHGFNMARGVQAYLDTVAKTPAKDPADAFQKLAMALLGKVGGASGPLYGSAFLGVSKALKGKAEFSDEDLAAAIEAGLAAIESRGKSTEGEKTMDDVWGPVARALKDGILTEEAVDSFVQATVPLQATKGRASYLGERSIGHIDPGAFSSGVLFKAMLKAR